MATFHVYSRQGCHLCEVLIEELLALLGGRAALEVRDIDSSPEWRARYDTRVPVVTFNRQFVCEHRLDRRAVAQVLGTIAANNS